MRPAANIKGMRWEIRLIMVGGLALSALVIWIVNVGHVDKPPAGTASMPSSLSSESAVYGCNIFVGHQGSWDEMCSFAADRNQPQRNRLAALRELRRRNALLSRRQAGLVWRDLDAGGVAEMARIYRLEEREWFEGFLVSLLQTGSDLEASKAILAMGVLGGSENVARLADILNDDAWPDGLRYDAARALWRVGGDATARMAIRGLAALGGEDAVSELGAVLADTALPQSLRMEAARALGRLGKETAAAILLEEFSRSADPDVQVELIACLGEVPFDRVQDFWRDVSQSGDATIRAAGAEALAGAGQGAVPLLKELLASDPDPGVREESAWALSAQEPGGGLAAELRHRAAVEPEPDVRRRIYEAMLAQDEPLDPAAAGGLLQEADPDARVAALNAIADSVGRGRDARLAAMFDQEIVPELVLTAESHSSANLRMRAVFALRRASTPASFSALRILSGNATPAIATAALNGLNHPSHP